MCQNAGAGDTPWTGRLGFAIHLSTGCVALDSLANYIVRRLRRASAMDGKYITHSGRDFVIAFVFLCPGDGFLVANPERLPHRTKGRELKHRF